jgi:hypothetical protein
MMGVNGFDRLKLILLLGCAGLIGVGNLSMEFDSPHPHFLER